MAGIGGNRLRIHREDDSGCVSRVAHGPPPQAGGRATLFCALASPTKRGNARAPDADSALYRFLVKVRDQGVQFGRESEGSK